uniref:Uncharacterized protein n=1 Tax=Oryza brachyantha TaxID=4533 RepID=J3LIF8_ORYBR
MVCGYQSSIKLEMVSPLVTAAKIPSFQPNLTVQQHLLLLSCGNKVLSCTILPSKIILLLCLVFREANTCMFLT